MYLCRPRKMEGNSDDDGKSLKIYYYSSIDVCHEERKVENEWYINNIILL